jgi:hypothetical protein
MIESQQKDVQCTTCGRDTKELDDFWVNRIVEKWSKKYKKSINCNNPKGFSQKAHCEARKKRKSGGETKSKSPFK